MTLTTRQRTKINAALCLLHDNGSDPNAVIGMAKMLERDGYDTRSAFEAAINTYLDHDPHILPTLSKVLGLIEASDDATVDQYDHALSTYVETEDDSALSALAPMIAQDSLALALRDGEISVEEAASGDLHKALGFEPGQALLDAADPTTMPKRDGAVAPLPQQETQVWKRTDPPMDGSQMPTGFGPAGFVAVGARTRWARNTFEPGTARYPAEPAQTF